MIDDAVVAQFDADGVACLRGLIDGRWLEIVGQAIEDDISSPGPHFHGYAVDGEGSFHGNLRVWEHHDAFRAYCFDSPLPDVARALLRSDRINLFYDQLFVKDAGTDSPTRWHNDQPYWPVRGHQVMSFWLALDPTDLANGGLEFVAGSHRWDRWFQPEPFGPTDATGGYETNPDYEPMPDIEAERERLRILSWELEPGDVLAFHALTVHGAPPNLDLRRRRRGYTVRYTGDDARYYEGPGLSEPLLANYLTSGDRIGGSQFPSIPA